MNDVADPYVRIIGGSCTKCGESVGRHPFEPDTLIPFTARFSQIREWTKNVPHYWGCDGQIQLELEPA